MEKRKKKSVSGGEMARLPERIAALEAERDLLAAEAAFCQSRARLYQQISDTAPAAFVMRDLAGRVTEWNRAAELLFGWTREEAIGRDFFEFLVPATARAQIEAVVQALLRGGSPGYTVTENLTKSGRTILCEWNNAIEYDEEGQAAGILSIGIDLTERIEALEAVQESGEMFRTIAEQALMTIAIIQDGMLRYANPTFAALTEYTVDEVMGWQPYAYFKLIHDDDRPRVTELTRRMRSGEQHIARFFSYRLVTKLGKIKWVEQYSRRISYRGMPAEFLTAIDITARRKTEEALRESERKYRLLAENSGDVIWTLNTDLRFTYVSPSVERIYGYPPEEFERLTLRDIMTEVSFRETMHAYATRWKEEAHGRGHGLSIRLELQQPRKDGTLVWTEVVTNAIRDAEGHLVGLVGITRDISDRKRTEEALRLSEANLVNAARLAQVVPWAWYPPTGEVVWSEDLTKMLGLPEAEPTPEFEVLLGRIHPEDRNRVRRAFLVALHGRGPYEVEFRYTRQDDPTPRYGVALGTVEWDEAGQPIRMMGAFQDITDRRRAERERQEIEERMLQAQKLESLGVLAGGIAHDFNNLLVAMLGNADLALAELPAQSPAREKVADVMRAAQRAADLCHQMLAYSGKGRLIVQSLDLSEVVREMAKLLEISISKKAILRYHFASDLPPISADATQVRQIVMNLITNASEALEEQTGIITLRTGALICDQPYLESSYLSDDLEPGTYVFVEVEDTGCGMDEDTLRRIFDPFFSSKFTGRGLGLAAVLGIVRGHRGAIRVSSEVGKGSIFRVLLPAQSGDVSKPLSVSRESAVAWRGEGHVLLVDDEDVVRRVAKRMLERMGLQVIEAENGRDAVAQFRRHKEEIRCVLLDLTMPQMDGEETYRELRGICPDVPVILASGYGEQEMDDRFHGMGMTGFVQKPYLFRVLNEAVRLAFAPKA